MTNKKGSRSPPLFSFSKVIRSLTNRTMAQSSRRGRSRGSSMTTGASGASGLRDSNATKTKSKSESNNSQKLIHF